MAKIDPEASTPSQRIVAGAGAHEGSETTHYSVIDAAGNAVSVTFTINGPFGAKVIAGHTGFFLNDEMDDFTIRPGTANMYRLVQGSLNAIVPGKRPLSSMSPTVVTKDGHIVLVLGSPAGSRIITTTLETILNVVDHGMTIQEAVDAPRIHHQWQPDEIDVEPGAVSADTAAKLGQMGYKIVEQKPWGAAEAIFVPPQTGQGTAAPALGIDAVSAGPRLGWIYGARDDRRPAGSALGY